MKEPKSVACDFEESTCGYTSDGDAYYNDWIRTNGSLTGLSIVDHTLATPYGYYMYAPKETDQSPSNVARLKSITLIDLKVKCMTFYFNMYGDDSNSLDVLIKQSSTYSLWSSLNEDVDFSTNSVN